MDQTVYGLSRDNGDGSASIVWFKDPVLANRLMDSDDPGVPSYIWESFSQNDAGPAVKLTFPEGVDLEACGFSFSDDHYRLDLTD